MAPQGRSGDPRSRPRIAQSQEGRQTEDSSGRDMDIAGSRPRGLKRGRGEDSSRGPSEMAPHQDGSTPDDRDGNEHAPIMNAQAAQDRESLSHWQPTTSFERSAWKELNKDWHRSMRDAEVYYSKDRRGASKDCVLMAHPMWKGKKPHAFMLFAIKWVVICRTDDRHPLPQPDIGLLKWIGTSLDPDANDKPFGIRHQEHQHNIREQGGWSSPEADLLSAIWRMTGSSARLTRPASDPYVVSTSDLTILIDALDNFGQGGIKISCEVHYQMFQGTQTGPVYSSGIAELRTLYRNCWLNVQRAKARREREGVTQDLDLSRSGLGEEVEEEEIQNGLSVINGAGPKTHRFSPLIGSGDTDAQNPDAVLLQSLPRDIPNLEPRRTRPKKAVCYKFPYCTCIWSENHTPCQRE
ncbi:hypothetical protein NCS52_01202500 [Fusarium sp. LHS14.1]|nr:hypothetical protein NCS52_01202500 [Fusarium sp. LHS14.1]